MLRSAGPFAGNLPQQLSSFVGRDELLAEVAELVRANRLVTLSGVGGVGKTRLALEVGAGLAGEFPDGVWVVELASVGDAASVPAAIATALGITPQGDARAHRHRGRGAGGPTAAAGASTTASTCSPRPAAAIDAILASVRERQGARHLSRVPAGRRRDAASTVSPLALDGGVASDAVTLFVERARAVRPDVRAAGPETAAAVTEICETLDGLPLGHRAGCGADGRDERRRGAGPARRPVPAAARVGARPERQQTLRHAVAWSYDLLTTTSASCCATRRSSPAASTWRASAAVVDGADDVDVLGRLDSLVRKSLVVADHTPPAPATACSRRSGSSPRTGWPKRAAASDCATGTPRTSPARRPRRVGALERAGLARRRRLGGGRARQPAAGVPLERRAGRAGGRHRHRRARRADGLLGRAVRDGGVGRGAAASRDRGRRPPPAPPLHRRRLRVLRRAGPRPRPRTRTGPTELEIEPGYESCEPGYATFIEALGQVYCGDLDRYVELTGDGGAQLPERRGATASPRTSTVCSRAAGSTRRWRSPSGGRGGPRARQPVLDRLRAVDRRAGVLEGGPAARAGGLGRGRRASSASTASSSSRASWPATRRACTPRTASPRPRWRCSTTPIAAFHRAGNVPQLDHHPGQRARPVRAARPARAGGDAARRHGPRAGELPPRPELAELGERLARAARRGAGGGAHDRAGAALDLNDAAVVRRGSRSTLARRDARRRRRADARPGGLSRREVEVLRLVADGPTTREIADAAVHLGEDRRPPHPAHLHEDRRLQPRRRHPLGGGARDRRDDAGADRHGRRPSESGEMGSSTDAAPPAACGE